MITAEICVPAHVRSKGRNAWHFAIVAICVRSQMLCPVELRAPVKSRNLRRNGEAVK